MGGTMNYSRPAWVKQKFKSDGAAHPRSDAGQMARNYGNSIPNVAAVWIKTLAILQTTTEVPAGPFEPSTLYAPYNAIAQIVARILWDMGWGDSVDIDIQAQRDRAVALGLGVNTVNRVTRHGTGGSG